VTQYSKTRFSIFIAAFCLVGFFAFFEAVSTPMGNTNATLYLTPSNQKVSAGKSLIMEVWMDAKNQPVNAVQANLIYPTDKFDYGGIDTNGSAFEIEAQSTGGNGQIKIARGHIGTLTGPQLVARVSLVTKAGQGNGSIDFAKGSAIVRSTDNANVLGSTDSGRYRLGVLVNNVFSRGANSISKQLLTPLLK
jgi:hypothetical protein